MFPLSVFQISIEKNSLFFLQKATTTTKKQGQTKSKNKRSEKQQSQQKVKSSHNQLKSKSRHHHPNKVLSPLLLWRGAAVLLAPLVVLISSTCYHFGWGCVPSISSQAALFFSLLLCVVRRSLLLLRAGPAFRSLIWMALKCFSPFWWCLLLLLGSPCYTSPPSEW